MNVRKLMRTDLVTLQADEPLINAVEAAAAEGIRHLPILEGERLVGIVSENDIKHATPSPLVEGNEAEYRRILDETPLSRVMRRAPIAASPDATMADVVRLLLEHKVGAIPIVEGERLVGIVSELDVHAAFLRVLEALEQPPPHPPTLTPQAAMR